MYIVVVLLTMLIAPGVSLVVDHGAHPQASLLLLTGKWWVFWAVGVRLLLAGLRQMFQPSFTAREIFHMKSEEALPLVRELGVANFAAGVVGAASLVEPTFVLPAAISAAIFFGIAGFTHIGQRDKSFNEVVAMVSDLFAFLVLGGFAGATLAGLA
jgi:hypothetical protein